MKIKTLAVISLLSCAVLPSVHAGGFFFGISDGHGGHRGWHHRPYYHRPFCGPTIVVRETPPVRVVSCDIPYGDLERGRVYSPWSDFSMSVGGKESGEVVYDPETGRAFRIP